jgi:hypothetical protein
MTAIATSIASVSQTPGRDVDASRPGVMLSSAVEPMYGK